MKRWILVLVFIATLQIGWTQSSVLSQGDWFKVGIIQSGIYKIDRNYLQSLGLNTEGLDPKKLMIFGNGGGGALPQRVGESRMADLHQNPLFGVGVDDGVFNEGDHFLFYGNGPDKLVWEQDRWSYEKNIYSDTSYYFITVGVEDGKRIGSKSTIEGDFPMINTYRDVYFHESDEKNVLESGRKWYGDRLSRSQSLSRAFPVPVTDLVDSVYVQVDVMAQVENKTTYSIAFNGEVLGSISADSIRTDANSTYEPKGRENTGYFAFVPGSGSHDLSITLQDPGSKLLLFGYIDRIVASYNRRLKFTGGSMIFFSPQSLDLPFSTYEITATTANMQIWDITNPTSPEVQPASNDGNSYRFNASSGMFRNFVAFSGDDFPRPIKFHPVANQNIRDLSPKDGLIVTHRLFASEAERLAQFHRDHDGLDVEVVNIQQVYNEFSSGMQDITAIRDAIKHFYDQYPDQFKYVLLFGDGSYDYKNRISNNTNFIPIYESYNSLDPVATYSSEDYFGFLEDHEGEWPEGQSAINHTLEVGVGRLPVTTLEEARNVVNKIIRYSSSPKVQGIWKNSVTYVADDGDRNIHMADAEDLADYLSDFQGQTSLSKLYIDAFPQQVSQSAQRAPLVSDQLMRAIKQGTMLVNYLGHGSEERWAEETVLNHEFIRNMDNKYKLPVFVTATCEFGRYDDPVIDLTAGVSGAEKLILKPDGGAIALLTTTRPVFAFSNFFVNAAFHSFFFDKSLRLGDVIRLTKNNSQSGVRNRNFSLLGDPMMRLAHPDYNIVLTELNGSDQILTNSDTLSALEKISLAGRVEDLEGNLVGEFNGGVLVTVFDRQTEKETLGQENSPFTYKVRENRLFNGEASVTNGEFEINFVLPKNISYRFEQGKITMYARDINGFDATGSNQNVLIGGSSSAPEMDSTPPKVTAYFNDPSFNNGNIIGTSSLFFAEISDASGINISGIGLSQDMVLILNDTLSYVLNNFYTADLDTYTSGKVIFPINDLPAGAYNGTLKVWDIHNNSTTVAVYFTVSNQPRIQLFNVVNYPNPASDHTFLQFEHDRQGDELEVTVDIFNMRGARVLNDVFEIEEGGPKIDPIRIALPPGNFEEGLYIYRMQVKSDADGAVGRRVGRLLMIK